MNERYKLGIDNPIMETAKSQFDMCFSKLIWELQNRKPAEGSVTLKVDVAMDGHLQLMIESEAGINIPVKGKTGKIKQASQACFEGDDIYMMDSQMSIYDIMAEERRTK